MSGLPPLPAIVSADGSEIWDWAIQTSRSMERARKVGEIKSAIMRPDRCGDCSHWMHSNACPREYRERGRRRGPSMNDHKCALFARCWSRQQHVEKLQAELLALSESVPC